MQEKQQAHWDASTTAFSSNSLTIVLLWQDGVGLAIKALTSEVTGQCLASRNKTRLSSFNVKTKLLQDRLDYVMLG